MANRPQHKGVKSPLANNRTCWDLPNYILNVYYVFHFVYRLYSLNASFVSFTRLHSFTPHCSFTPLRISVGIIHKEQFKGMTQVLHHLEFQ